MSPLYRMLAALLFLIPPLSGATGQELPSDATAAQADWSAIAACLRDSGQYPRACIGAVAVVCAARQGSGNRTEVEIACNQREAAVWRERLDAAASLLLNRLETAPRNRFLAQQRSWEGYAAQRCAFVAGSQAPTRSALAQTRCDLGEVANRAIDIERLAGSADPASALTR